MMRKNLQYLQSSVICLVLTLVFALSSLRPALAFQDDSLQGDKKVDTPAHTLDLGEYRDGTAFSGVYNWKTQQMAVKPSVENSPLYLSSCLFDDNKEAEKNCSNKSNEAVKRKGGHSELEKDLIINNFLKDKQNEVKKYQNENVGFAFEKKDNENLEIKWISGMINKRNYRKYCAPEEYHEQIRKALEQKTGYEFDNIISVKCERD